MRAILILTLLALALPARAEPVWCQSPDGAIITGGCAAGPQYDPGWAQFETTSRTYAAWLAGVTAKQAARDTLATGVAVQSASTPALNGTYALDAASRSLYADAAAQCRAGAFPDGSASDYALVDSKGTAHTVPTCAAMQSLSQGLARFVAALAKGTAPAQPVQVP